MADVDEARLWMGWGDWNVICAVGKEQVPELVALAAAGGVATTVIGRCLGDAIGVFVERAGRRLPAPRIESERFAVDSWFVKGIDAYVEALLKAELP